MKEKEGPNRNENVAPSNQMTTRSSKLIRRGLDSIISRGETSEKILTSNSEITVSKQGDGQYKTIGDAINNAKPRTRILVKPGVYNEGFVIDKPLEIIGDGESGKVIIDSALADCIQMKAETASVRGLVLHGRAIPKDENCFATVNIFSGELMIEDCEIISDLGMCVSIRGANSNPLIRNCKVHHGKIGGIFAWEDGRGIIEECDIFSNSNLGIGIKQSGNPVIRQCRIYDNDKWGVGIDENGKGLVEDCEIYANVQMGVAIKAKGNPTIQRCNIYQNKMGGVWVFEEGFGTVQDCDIYSNVALGVGISKGSNPIIRQCKIHNHAGQSGGVFIHEEGGGTLDGCEIFSNLMGVMISGSNPVIKQCKINRNTMYAVGIMGNSAATVEDCDLRWNAQGAWNIQGPVWLVSRNRNME